MSSFAEHLYRLLPGFYRQRDLEEGEPLAGLLAVLGEQGGLVRDDIARLYENLFIETCDDWVVPYLGDLLRVRNLHAVSPATFSRRAHVANTLGYRRRKGTAAMLEQLARDVTGWNARAVEFFERLATTQHLNHVRLFNHRTPHLSQGSALPFVDTPFDTVAHTADVRPVAPGRHNIPNVGLFLWRLQAYPIRGGAAREVGPARFTFSPLGNDAPLFTHPEVETQVTHLAEPENVPDRVGRRWAREHVGWLYGPGRSVHVVADGVAVALERVHICNLTDWIHQPPPGDVALDPVLGRLAWRSGEAPASVRVDYHYGFSADLGGGSYDRTDSLAEWPAGAVTWQLGVSRDAALVASDPVHLRATLSEAVAAWNAQAAALPGTVGVIAVLDSASYEEDLTGAAAIDVPAGAQLLFVAADWPVDDVDGVPLRTPGRLLPIERRPHLHGDVSIRGGSGPGERGRIALNGLLVEGRVRVLDGDLGALELMHCTLVPGAALNGDGEPADPAAVSLDVASASGDPTLRNAALELRLERSIAGAVRAGPGVGTTTVQTSVIDGRDVSALTGRPLRVLDSTVFGAVAVEAVLLASNSLFVDVVEAEKRQLGCVRFSHVPRGSRVPRRFRCQPEVPEAATPAEAAALALRVRPRFTERDYGRPGYAQLRVTTAAEVRRGAEDESEMGVLRHLLQPQREANLLASLDEYLRFGLEAGIFYAT